MIWIYKLKVLITGSAGFIGFSLAIKLLKRNIEVIGIDNHNTYYDPKLKTARVALLENFKNYSHKTPMARMAKEEEITSSVLFLSDNQQSSYINGHNLVVDGGFTVW